jgi:hypothetical protein
MLNSIILVSWLKFILDVQFEIILPLVKTNQGLEMAYNKDNYQSSVTFISITKVL